MVSKNALRKHIEEANKKIIEVIDKIPINIWGFDDRTLEFLKARKHTMVKEKISASKLKRMDNKQRNALAREIGAVPKTVSEVYSLIANTKVGDKIPRAAPENPNKEVVVENGEDDDYEEDGEEEDDSLILDTEGDATVASVDEDVDDDESDEGDDTVDMEEIMQNPEVKEGMIDPHIMAILKRKGAVKRSLHQPAKSKNTKKPKLEIAENVVKEEDEPAVEGTQVAAKHPKKAKKKMTPAQKKERKIKLKENKKKQKEILNKSRPTLPPSNPQPGKAPQENGNSVQAPEIAYNKFEFSVKPEDQKKAEELTKKKNKLTGRDYKGLLQKVNKREEKISKLREADPDKAERLQENIKWSTVMNRAQGEKVRDNVEMLSKALKRTQKAKEKKKAKWGERLSKVESDKKKRQERRETNIQKRKDDKLQKKMERAKKKSRKS